MSIVQTERYYTMLAQFITLLNAQFLQREEGQGMAEYALIIALVAIVLVGSLTLLSGGIGDVFDSIVAGF